MNPKPEDINLLDMAWSLSRQVRYAGHTLGDPYHIAQHAVFVEHLLSQVITGEKSLLAQSFEKWMLSKGVHWKSIIRPSIARMHALIHDNTEAYLVDLPSPVKRHWQLRGPYKEMEHKLEGIIVQALGIPVANQVEELAVVWADLMALQIEASNLMPSRGRGWSGDFPEFDLSFMELMPPVMHWKESKNQYLKKYYELADQLGIRDFKYTQCVIAENTK